MNNLFHDMHSMCRRDRNHLDFLKYFGLVEISFKLEYSCFQNNELLSEQYVTLFLTTKTRYVTRIDLQFPSNEGVFNCQPFST